MDYSRKILRNLCSLVIVGLIILCHQPSLAQGIAPRPTDIVLQVIQNSATLQDKPGKAGTTVRTLTVGGRMVWDGTIQSVEGRNWIQVTTQDGIFWTSPDNEVLITADPSRVSFQMDRSVTFHSLTQPLVIYDAPNTSSKTAATIPTKVDLTVTDGPNLTNLYSWWKVKTADGKEGWLPDTFFGELEVVKPLRVYGYEVCEGFNLKQFGALGWDSIVDAIGSLIPNGERITCLGSTNLKGDGSPIVVILSRVEQGAEPHDTLRVFESFNKDWQQIYKQDTESYAKTDRISLHDLTGEGIPTLMWNVRSDGTGGILQINVLRYIPEATIQSILQTSAYKGSVMVGDKSLVVFEASYKENEPNCCPSGMHRMGYEWQTSKFVKTVDDTFPLPYYLQGAPQPNQ